MRCLLAVFLTGSFAAAAEPLKLVASFGTAKVVGSGGFLVSPDGKTVVIGDRWFDFESGKRLDPPFLLPEGASWHSLLSDGTVVMSREERLHFYLPKQSKPTMELEGKGHSIALSTNGKTALRRVQEENKTWTLQVASQGKGKWKTAFTDFRDAGGPSWKLSADGSRFVALEQRKKSLTVYTVAPGKSETLDLSEEKYRDVESPSTSADGMRVCLHNETSWKVFDTAKMELGRID